MVWKFCGVNFKKPSLEMDMTTTEMDADKATETRTFNRRLRITLLILAILEAISTAVMVYSWVRK